LDYRAFGRFLDFKEPFGSVYFLLNNSMGPTFYLWFLPAWGALVAILCSPSRIDEGSLEWFRASALWSSSYLLLALSAGYFPERYLAHMLVPPAILAGVSVHILLHSRTDPGWGEFGGGSAIRRLSISLIVALPIAVFLAATLMSVAEILDPAFLRARWQIGSILACWIVVTFGVGVRKLPRIDLAVSFVFACGAIWFLGERLFEWEFWASGESVPSGIKWVPLIGVGLASAFWARSRTRKIGEPLSVVIALVAAVVSTAPYLPSILSPQFTIRETSRDLALYLQGETEIISEGADGLFIDNRLPYESHFRESWANELPRVVVKFDYDPTRINFPVDSYEPVKTYDLYVSPRYSDAPARIVVYNRRAAVE
jgi:hypothetical protein